MSTDPFTLHWIPVGTLQKRLQRTLGAGASLVQGLIGDETADEVMEQVKLHFGERYKPALTGQPVIRVEMVSSGSREIKPLSAVLRWIRGDGRHSLGELDVDDGELPLYLDFIAIETGVSHKTQSHGLRWEPLTVLVASCRLLHLCRCKTAI